ncbi:hypothetical protein [Dolichospermum compactum]|uniref:hypothetical protein n=1 Tax=Dolichospermum compactum TaxID=136073 RepID=UPI0012FD571D|nr:hypothetical protein [Dolichospermum compactum]
MLLLVLSKNQKPKVRSLVTVTLAIGVSRTASRHAIVRKLPVVETLSTSWYPGENDYR